MDNLNEIINSVAKEDLAPEPEVTEETINRYTEFYKGRFIHHGYDNREPYNMNIMARYCARYYSGIESKGLCLIGEPGRGKTYAFKIMAKLFNKESKMFPANVLIDKWEVYGVKERSEFFNLLKGHKPTQERREIARTWRDCIIDDIGTEPTLNDYGTKREVIDTIIQHRTREFEDSGARTHMSMNLSLDGIQNRYGPRFVSRVHQLCHVVVLKGSDRRRD
jgi:DNA replication protein DnaC